MQIWVEFISVLSEVGGVDVDGVGFVSLNSSMMSALERYVPMMFA